MKGIYFAKLSAILFKYYIQLKIEKSESKMLSVYIPDCEMSFGDYSWGFASLWSPKIICKPDKNMKTFCYCAQLTHSNYIHKISISFKTEYIANSDTPRGSWLNKSRRLFPL